jgi:hypothetical protein
MADINLKTLTPDTSLPTTGFLFGADSQAATDPSVYGVTTAITAILGNAASSDELIFNSDTTFARSVKGARNFRFGAADASPAQAQTLNVQSVVAGTTNGAGAAFTINGSQGTGTGAGGSIVFQVAPAGGAGTAQNALVAALTIDSAKNVYAENTVYGGGAFGPSLGLGATDKFSVGSTQGFGNATVINCGTAGSVAFARESVSTGNVIIGNKVGGFTIPAFEFGVGAWTATPSAISLTAPSGAGTNIAGGSLTLLGGVSTGNAAGGSVNISVTPAGSSGSGRNTAVAALTIDSVGSVRVVQALTVATLPGTPLAGMIARVSNANAPVIGTTVAGGGAAYALVNYNGANWTVIGV